MSPLSSTSFDTDLDDSARKIAGAMDNFDAPRVKAGLLLIADRDPHRALTEGHNTLLEAMVRRHIATNAGDKVAAAAIDGVRRAVFDAVMYIAKEWHPDNSSMIVGKVEIQAEMFGEDDIAMRARQLLTKLASEKNAVVQLREEPRRRATAVSDYK